jgi:hypothetical protein
VVGAARLECGEPAAEARELIRRQLGDSFGDFFDFHVAQYSTAGVLLSAERGLVARANAIGWQAHGKRRANDGSCGRRAQLDWSAGKGNSAGFAMSAIQAAYPTRGPILHISWPVSVCIGRRVQPLVPTTEGARWDVLGEGAIA